MLRAAVQGGSWNAREGEEGETMAETMSGDMSAEILKAVQGLSAQVQGLGAEVQGLGAEVQGLGARMDRLETRVAALGDQTEKLTFRMDTLSAQMRVVTTQVDGLSVQMTELTTRMDKLEGRMDKLEGRMDKLEGRMDKQEGWLGELGKTFYEWGDKLRGQLKQDIQESFRQVHARVDRTDGAVVLMASVLRRPTELGEDLEKRLGELDAH
jgi:chromosome segregation ATPase